MEIISFGDNLHELPQLILWKRKEKHNVSICRSLKFATQQAKNYYTKRTGDTLVVFCKSIKLFSVFINPVIRMFAKIINVRYLT